MGSHIRRVLRHRGESGPENETQNRAEKMHSLQMIHGRHPQSEIRFSRRRTFVSETRGLGIRFEKQSSLAVSSRLEVEVKSSQHFAGILVDGIQAERRTGTVLMQPVVLVVPRKTSAAGHKRVEAEAHRVSRDVAKVGSRRSAASHTGRARRSVSLLRHSLRLVTADKNQLRAVYVMSLQSNSVPTGRLRASRKSRARHVVRGTSKSGTRAGCSRASIAVTQDGIAVTLAEPDIVRTVLRHHLQVNVLTEVELSDKALSAEALVADSRAAQWDSGRGQIIGRRISDHGIEPDALHSQLARVKSLTGGKKAGIGVRPRTQIDVSVTRTEQGRGNTRAVVGGVTHVLDTELVIADLPEDVAIIHRDEVVGLVNPSVTAKRENAFFRQQIVQLESSKLQVEPGTAEQVVEATEHLLEVKRPGGIGGRKQVEREILFQRAGGVEIEPAQIKARTRDSLDVGSSSGRTP